MATEGGRISPPGRWGGLQPPPMAGSIFFFSFFFFVRRKSRRRWTVGGSICSLEVGSGSFIWLVDLLIGCFDFILNLCIFLKMLKCQLTSGGQKTPPFCHDRMATALILVRE
jgi:hypothetical protein